MKKRLTFRQLLFEQQILGILLFSILVVFLWIISSIYFSYSASTLSQDDTQAVVPLSPEIPLKPLEELHNRRWWTQEELNQFSPRITIEDKTTGTTRVSTTSARTSSGG